MASDGGYAGGQEATPELPSWPKLTVPERNRLLHWLSDLPDAIVDHCSTIAEKRGLGGNLRSLIEVMEFAAGKVDRVALRLVMEDAARRISYQGARSLRQILPA